jgi:hypothetical protein
MILGREARRAHDDTLSISGRYIGPFAELLGVRVHRTSAPSALGDRVGRFLLSYLLPLFTGETAWADDLVAVADCLPV